MPDPARRINDWLATYATPTASVAHLLCDRHPAHHTALTEIGPDLRPHHLTYADLTHRSTRLATAMAHLGIRPGDHVATLLGKGIDLAVTTLAIWRLGAVHVPLFTAFAPSAIAQRLTHSHTALVITDDIRRPKLDPDDDLPPHPPWHIATTGPHPTRPGDHTLTDLETSADTLPPTPTAALGGDAPFVLLYTSGTAGPPRGVPIPVRALAALHAYHHYGLDVTDDDVYWNTSDPGWAYGLYYGLISPLLAGHRSLHLRAGFDPELTLDVLATYGVTNFAAAPTVYRTLRATVKTLPPEIAVRRLSSAGEPLGPDVIDWASDVFGVPVHDHYGQSELGMCAGQPNHPDAASAMRAASIGPALPGWVLSVLEPVDDTEAPVGSFGRVAIDVAASPLMWFEGYHDNPAASEARFSQDGRWYLTGDTGSRDREGYLYFSTRDVDAILMSGYRIGPFDVEWALTRHPAVAETAVYGVPDELRGQVVGASVVLNPGFEPGEELADELRETVRAKFAEHAYPRRIVFVDRLPRTPSGKIRRAQLRPGAR